MLFSAALVVVLSAGALWLVFRDSSSPLGLGRKPGEIRVNPKDNSKMVWIPAGEFLMGTTDEEIAAVLKKHPSWKAEWFADQRPRRRVHLDGYWIGKYEVTVAQYRDFCEETSREMPWPPGWHWIDDHPIVGVSWHDSKAYAEWAGGRLPTEAEWEKAARGTDGRKHPWGNTWDKNRCNSRDLKLQRAEPVGSFPADASPYGCHDMAGNVLEWCADWYGEDYYSNAPSRNPKGPSGGSDRILRGGGWYYAGTYSQCAGRYGRAPYDSRDFYGFRLCCSGK